MTSANNTNFYHNFLKMNLLFGIIIYKNNIRENAERSIAATNLMEEEKIWLMKLNQKG